MKPYYQDDYVTIYHGDCTLVLKEVNNNIDLVLTDPPYNVGLNYCDGDKRIDYKKWCQLWYELLSKPIALTPGMVNLNMWFDIAKPDWVMSWFKTNQCSPSALGGFNVWEPILIYGHIKKHVPQDGLITNIVTNQVCCGCHPCPKDEISWTKILGYLSKKDWIVLDPFLGSGTTAWCCKKLKRKCVGIEIEEKYCEIAAIRCQQTVMDFGSYDKQIEEKQISLI